MKRATVLCCLLLALVHADVQQLNGEDTQYDFNQHDGDYARSIREDPSLDLGVDGTYLEDNTQNIAPRAEDVGETNWDTDPGNIAPRAEDVGDTNWETDTQNIAPRAEDVGETNWDTDPGNIAPRADDVGKTNLEADPENIASRVDDVGETNLKADTQNQAPRGENVDGNNGEVDMQNEAPTTDVRADDTLAEVPEGGARQDDFGENPAEDGATGIARNDATDNGNDKDRSVNPLTDTNRSSKKKPTSYPNPSPLAPPMRTWGLTAIGCPPCWSWVLGWQIPPWCRSCSVTWPWLCWLCNWFPGFWWCCYCY